MTTRTLLLAAVVVLSAARPSLAQTPKGVEILSPKPDALQTSRRLSVRVRIRGEVTGFQAYLRGHDFSDVTNRFGPSRRGVRTARFSLGRDLQLGPNDLFVQVHRPSGVVESEQVHFTAALRLRGMLGLGVRVGTREAPLTIRVRAPRATSILAKLNGRDVEHLFQRDGVGRWIARLATNDRLRFGSNASASPCSTSRASTSACTVPSRSGAQRRSSVPDRIGRCARVSSCRSTAARPARRGPAVPSA